MASLPSHGETRHLERAPYPRASASLPSPRSTWLDHPANLCRVRDRPAPASPSTRPLFAVKLGGVLIPLRAGATLLGRGSSADIVLPSEQASRSHARILIEGDVVTIEDLNSRNGVFVNEVQIRGVTRLAVRDRIRIGDLAMRLVPFDDLQRTRSGDALPDLLPGESPGSPSERPAPTLDVVGPLVTKMLALGKKDEAERLLRLPLQRLLLDSVQGVEVSCAITARAAELAVKVAAATGRPQYVDLILRVHAAHQRPLPLSAIDELYRTLRSIRGVDQALLAEYVDGLEERVTDFGPSERFALSRLSGLRQLARA